MEKKSLSLGSLILIIFTSVFGFANIPIAYYLMGYASIIWYVLAALCFFLPYAFIFAEFGAAFPDSKGGIYVNLLLINLPLSGFLCGTLHI